MHKLYGFSRYAFDNKQKNENIFWEYPDRYDFCNCCGAEQVSEDTVTKHSPPLKQETVFNDSMGILVIFDKVFEENNRGYKKIHHVETSNGPVTVCITTGLTQREIKQMEEDDEW